MDQLIAVASGRVARSLRTWPTPRGWSLSAAVSAATLIPIGALGLTTGLYRLGPADTRDLPLRLITTLIAPGIGEELVFRGLLIPGRDEARRFWPAFGVSMLLFVGWHVVEAKTILRSEAATFQRADFLGCAAILGVGCAFLRRRTGSLWPAVGLHWVMVTLWQTWFGGLSMAE